MLFVAEPATAPDDQPVIYARPDDPFDCGSTCRDVLIKYNETPEHNPLGLMPACQLYANPTYQRLVDAYGLSRLFILSAGWGLISARFLTPAYDITFSASARGEDGYKRRKKDDQYKDLSMVPPETIEPMVFLGGKDYLSLFCALTANSRGERIVFYNSETLPNAPGCTLNRYQTTTRTNWHYECANALLDGSVRF